MNVTGLVFFQGPPRHILLITAIKPGEMLTSLENATQQIQMKMTLQMEGCESFSVKGQGTILSTTRKAVCTHMAVYHLFAQGLFFVYLETAPFQVLLFGVSKSAGGQ